ncbi:MAG: sugar phosphate nucleotidyltransferase [Candidatus Korarchaeota archaeon]|nr:sugar phosphate nucleotidyltransferase [Candidatus Korarchaeota archaeon]
MRAVLLAAGEGKRLRPVTFDRPKPIIPLAGFSLAHYHLSLLSSLGVDEAAVVVGFGEEKVKAALGDGRELGLEITYLKQDRQLGTAHALMVAEQWLEGSEPFLLIYSDVYIPPDTPKALLSAVEGEGAEAAVAVASVETPWEFGVVEADPRGRLRRIVEKPRRGEEPSNLVIAGAFAFKRSIFGELKSTKPSPRGELELTDSITMLASRSDVLLVGVGDRWTDAGRPEDLLRASSYLLDDVAGSRLPQTLLKLVSGRFYLRKSTEGGAEIRPPTFVGANAILEEGSVLGPYAILEGFNSVGSRSLIERSLLLSGSSVGAGSRVKRAILCSNSSLSPETRAVSEDGGFSVVVGPGRKLREKNPPAGTVVW